MSNRRQFLIGLLSTALATGEGFRQSTQGFVGELGKGIPIHRDDWEMARDILIEDAHKSLPHGAVFEVRMGYPSDYGRTYMMSWYANTKMQQLKPANATKPEFDPEGGFYLLGRCQCP